MRSGIRIAIKFLQVKSDFERKITAQLKAYTRELSKRSMLAAVMIKERWKLEIKAGTLGLAGNRPLTKLSKKGSSPLLNHGTMLSSLGIRSMGNVLLVGFISHSRRAGKKITSSRLASLHQRGNGSGVITIKAKNKKLPVPLTKEAGKYFSPRKFPRCLQVFKISSGDCTGILREKESRKFQYALFKKIKYRARPHVTLISEKIKGDVFLNYKMGLHTAFRLARPAGGGRSMIKLD